MSQLPLPASTTKQPSILIIWPATTALGAGLFGAMLGTALMVWEGDAWAPVLVGMLLGGAITGWMEWRTLRHYGLAVGVSWVGLTTGMVLLLHLMMLQWQLTQFWLVVISPLIWGTLLDGGRAWLLRSQGFRSKEWFWFCVGGWSLDVVLFVSLGMGTLDFMWPVVAFLAFNGLVHGIWIGLWRAAALKRILHDRHEPSSSFPPMT